MSIQDFINYIDSRLDENPYEGSWINDLGVRIPADVGYVYDWWRDCMKPELLRKFGKDIVECAREHRPCFGKYYDKNGNVCEDGAAGLCSYCVECQQEDIFY